MQTAFQRKAQTHTADSETKHCHSTTGMVPPFALVSARTHSAISSASAASMFRQLAAGLAANDAIRCACVSMQMVVTCAASNHQRMTPRQHPRQHQHGDKDATTTPTTEREHHRAQAHRRSRTHLLVEVLAESTNEVARCLAPRLAVGALDVLANVVHLKAIDRSSTRMSATREREVR
jgi:hypothetical protein